MLGAISGSPFGGEKTILLGDIEGTSGYVSMSWGFGTGGLLLIVAGIIMLVAGVMEFVANKIFFQPKVPYGKQKAPKHQPPVVATPPPKEEKPKEAPKGEKKTKSKGKSETVSCPKCGRELKKGAQFCADCGGKI
jgi:hypothetical protein